MHHHSGDLDASSFLTICQVIVRAFGTVQSWVMQPGGLCFPSLLLLSGLFSLIVFWHHYFPGATTFPAQAPYVWPPLPPPPPHPRPSNTPCNALINLRATCDTHYGHRSELKENGFGVLQARDGFFQRFQHPAEEMVKGFLSISRKYMQHMGSPGQVQHLLPFPPAQGLV